MWGGGSELLGDQRGGGLSVLSRKCVGAGWLAWGVWGGGEGLGWGALYQMLSGIWAVGDDTGCLDNDRHHA